MFSDHDTHIHTLALSSYTYLSFTLSVFFCYAGLSPSVPSGRVDPPLLNFIISPLSEFPDYKSLTFLSQSQQGSGEYLKPATQRENRGPVTHQDRSVCKFPTPTPEDYMGSFSNAP